MSIQETKSVPNVYKTEKFVIVDTHDTYLSDKFSVTKPNLLTCLKVYTAFDRGGNVKEFVDKLNPYTVAVPLNLWQMDPTSTNTVDEGSNSLICPPYVATAVGMVDQDITLSENILARNIHRGSVIYASLRDSGIDVFGHNDRDGIYASETVDYIDINADGRSLKVSSLTGKSNNVDISDSAFNAGSLDNLYQGKFENIQTLMNACVTNEDAGIDYITELDQVARLWQAAGSSSDTAEPVAGKTYALIFNPSAGSDGGDYPVLRFKEVTSGGGGGASAFTGLSDTPPNYTDQDNKLVQVKTGGELEFTHLNTKNVEHVTTGDTPYFLVAKNAANGTATSMQLRKFEGLLGDAAGYKDERANFEGFSSADDSATDLAILTIDGNGGESKFRALKYLTQLGGVSVATSLKEALAGEGHPSQKALVTLSHSADAGGNTKVTFDPLGSLITNEGAAEAAGDLGTEYLAVKNDSATGKILGKSFHTLLGQAGAGSVKWNGNNMVLGAGTSHTEPLEGDALKLRYEPKLFGICKENGDYEYRYFLTSAIIQ